MNTTRRAVFLSSIEQYLALAINVGVMATMARILTPDEAGHAVTGIGIGAVALSLREFVTPEFLIQKADIGEEDVRTSVTLLAGVTVVVIMGMMAVAGTIADFYVSPELVLFLFLLLMASLAEVLSLPVVAVLRRNMDFAALARIRTLALIVLAGSTIALSVLGAGYLSYAWGMLAGAISLTVMAIHICPYRLSAMCRPSLAKWQSAFTFGRFKGASQFIDRTYEILPQLILGKFVSMTSVGLYNRANTVCSIPDRIIMSAFYATAFPALAANVREGREIKTAYLKVLTYLSGLYWPGVLLVALSADPIVKLILGTQWHEAVPLIRLLAMASVFWVTVIATNPLLLALGQNRDAFLSTLLCRGVAAILLCAASAHGVMAMALVQFIALPAQMLVSLYFARRHLRFTLAELLAAVAPSVIVTGISIGGPVALFVGNGWNLTMDLVDFGLTLLLAAGGWLLGLVVTDHILLTEVRLIVTSVLRYAPWLRHRFPASEA